MKHTLKLGIILLTLMVMTIPVYAKTETIKLENKSITLDVHEKNGRKLYPLRALCNELNIEIIEVTENRITLKQDNNTVGINRKNKIVVNDAGYFVSDVEPLELNNTVYVPIRVISYMFGYNIDASNGMTLTKVQNFTLPKPSYASTLLGNDIDIILEMSNIVDAPYYLKRLQQVMYSYDYFTIKDCKDYTLTDQMKLDELAIYLKSQSGKALYNEYSKLLDYFYDAFYYVDVFNYEQASKTVKTLGQCLDSISTRTDTFMNELYKNGACIQ